MSDRYPAERARVRRAEAAYLRADGSVIDPAARREWLEATGAYQDAQSAWTRQTVGYVAPSPENEASRRANVEEMLAIERGELPERLRNPPPEVRLQAAVVILAMARRRQK